MWFKSGIVDFEKPITATQPAIKFSVLSRYFNITAKKTKDVKSAKFVWKLTEIKLYKT